MTRWILIVMVVALSCVALGGAGCGNVYLQGDALTAAETSALDAYQAVQRAGTGNTGVSPVIANGMGVQPVEVGTSQPASSPAVPQWLSTYLTENFKQWRSFVRSARKDLAWGPKLEDE